MKTVRGSVVKSNAGRDQGRYYVAVSAEDRFVFIADGKVRKLQNPKRKNVKHISPTSVVISLSEMTNKKLSKLLSELTTQGSVEVPTTGRDERNEGF